MGRLSVLSDAAAATDRLSFDRYVNPILAILTDPEAETPFTVGIYGAWGTGKSSLLRMVDETLAAEYASSFVRVHFNPWVHRREPNMLVPLLHTLHDTLKEDKKERFLESVARIGNVLVRLGADILLKKITADAVSLEKLESIEKAYCKERGRVESELRTLRATLQTEMDGLAAKGARVVLFIDDSDRCDPLEVIDLLEAIKLFFDLRHVFILLAIDKEIVDRGVQVRYSKFAFGDAERSAAIGAEYLEKLVQLPLTLLPLNDDQVAKYIEYLCSVLRPSPLVVAQTDLLRKAVARNPRKIKRVLNILSTTLLTLASDDTKDRAAAPFDPAIVARLVVLQVQNGDLYNEIVKQPDVLLALQMAYAGDVRVDEVGDYAKDFGARKESVQRAVKRFYRAESSSLGALFAESPYSKVRDLLPEYLSLLTG